MINSQLRIRVQNTRKNNETMTLKRICIFQHEIFNKYLRKWTHFAEKYGVYCPIFIFTWRLHVNAPLLVELDNNRCERTRVNKKIFFVKNTAIMTNICYVIFPPQHFIIRQWFLNVASLHYQYFPKVSTYIYLETKRKTWIDNPCFNDIFLKHTE